MTSHHYAVQATNTLSDRRFQARVVASAEAPRVREVTIGQYNGGPLSPRVVVHFDPNDLTSGPGAPFRFAVACISTDAQGRRLEVEDGSDELASFAAIDADYDVCGDGFVDRWTHIDHLEVRVTVDEVG